MTMLSADTLHKIIMHFLFSQYFLQYQGKVEDIYMNNYNMLWLVFDGRRLHHSFSTNPVQI